MNEHKDLIPLEKIGGKMKKINWKKHIKKDVIILSSALLIGGAVYLNWSFFSSGNAEAGNTSGLFKDAESTVVEAVNKTEEYFTETLMNRQRARDESMEVLSLIIDDENSAEDAKSEAVTNLNNIASEIEAESNIETLVLSKGFEECVAVISNGSASVIVKSDGLLENEITQIQEIVYEQSGITPTALKIIQK